ncbi:unnamed protein product [Cunninghamella echinulata]
MVFKLHSVFVLLVILLSLEQVFGQNYSNMTFTADRNLKGKSFKCDAVEYQRCHSLESISSAIGMFSSGIFTHKDPYVKDVSVTFYTGWNCGGKWFRKSGSMTTGQSWKWSDFGDYDGKIYSFKIANFKTSNTNSGSKQIPPDSQAPIVAKCGVIRYA